MAEIQSMGAEPRPRAGKGAARATRREGRVPGVIYGNKEAPTLISVEPRTLQRHLHRPGFFATLLDIELDGARHRVLPRDVQFDPVSDKPVHVDFMRVTAATRVRVDVPVLFANEAASPGIKRGGVLNIVRHEIEMVCAAEHIPPSITIDLTGLDIGDSVHISMVKLPEHVTPAIADRDFTIATIAAPSVERVEVPTPTEAEAAAAEAAAAAAPAAGAPAAAEKPEKPEKK
jgi:large subunit ribosomal protein L25